MSDRQTKTPVKLFIQNGKVPARHPSHGLRKVWITLAVLLAIEIAATVWFLRSYGKTSQLQAEPSASLATTPQAK